jgi:hypothetical protein
MPASCFFWTMKTITFILRIQADINERPGSKKQVVAK